MMWAWACFKQFAGGASGIAKTEPLWKLRVESARHAPVSEPIEA